MHICPHEIALALLALPLISYLRRCRCRPPPASLLSVPEDEDDE